MYIFLLKKLINDSFILLHYLSCIKISKIFLVTLSFKNIRHDHILKRQQATTWLTGQEAMDGTYYCAVWWGAAYVMRLKVKCFSKTRAIDQHVKIQQQWRQRKYLCIFSHWKKENVWKLKSRKKNSAKKYAL